MSNSVPGLGDPLLNSWIMAWDCHQLLRNPLKLFEANSFFPEPHSLAYSEHLFASALLALPVYLVSDNAILGYNIVQFLSFVLAGLGMFLLVDYLTGNWWASLISGIIFAFCPYKFGQIWHLQMLTAQWIPFTFLFLHKFTRNPRWKHLGLFIIFFLLQILSSTYYGLFLSFGVGLYILYILIIGVGRGVKVFMLKIILSTVLIFVLIIPFFIPYYNLSKEMGFERKLEDVEQYSPDILSYLVLTPWHKVFYIKYLKPFRPYGKGGEAILFPGGLAILFAFLGLAAKSVFMDRKKRNKHSSQSKFFLYFYLISKYLCIASLILLLIFLFFNKQLSSLINLLTLLLILIIFWLLWLFAKSHYFSDINVQGHGLNLNDSYYIHFYLLLGSISFLVSLGPTIYFRGEALGKGPFIWLHQLMPGFKALRVSGRMAILVMLSIAIIAGFGTSWIMNLLKKKSYSLMVIVGFFFITILCYEYAAFPLNLEYIPKETPQIYKWLAKEKGDFAIIEFPLYRAWHLEAPYLYWSTKHWKKIVNGYGAFIPSHFWTLKHYFHHFPSIDYLELVKQYCPVKYVIVHLDKFPDHMKDHVYNQLNSDPTKNILKLKQKIDNTYVYELSRGGHAKEIIRHFPDWMLLEKNLSFYAISLYEDLRVPHKLCIFLNDKLLSTFRLDDRLRYHQIRIPDEQIKEGINIVTFRSAETNEKCTADGMYLFRLDRLVISNN
jgi:hypothetical protein